MNKEKTIYCGSGKKMNDKWLKVTISPDKIKEYIEEFQGHKFIRLNINISDEADQYGKDVSLTVDTWKPKTDKMEGTPRQVTEDKIESEIDDDLPF